MIKISRSRNKGIQAMLTMAQYRRNQAIEAIKVLNNDRNKQEKKVLIRCI